VHEKVLVEGRNAGQSEIMKSKKGSAGRSEKLKVKEPAAVYGAAFQNEAPAALLGMAEKFGLRQETLSRMTGFSLRAVAGWANGKRPSAPVQRALIEMDRLLDALSRLMKPKEVGRWLKVPNPAFDGSTPAQLIERGQTDRIWRMLYFVESGEPG
jgi:hypothetical protein